MILQGRERSAGGHPSSGGAQRLRPNPWVEAAPRLQFGRPGQSPQERTHGRRFATRAPTPDQGRKRDQRFARAEASA
jgi:hypothetical protein